MIDFNQKLVVWGNEAGIPITTAPERIREDLARLVKIAYDAGVSDATTKAIDCDGAHHAEQ